MDLVFNSALIRRINIHLTVVNNDRPTIFSCPFLSRVLQILSDFREKNEKRRLSGSKALNKSLEIEKDSTRFDGMIGSGIIRIHNCIPEAKRGRLSEGR